MRFRYTGGAFVRENGEGISDPEAVQEVRSMVSRGFHRAIDATKHSIASVAKTLGFGASRLYAICDPDAEPPATLTHAVMVPEDVYRALIVEIEAARRIVHGTAKTTDAKKAACMASTKACDYAGEVARALENDDEIDTDERKRVRAKAMLAIEMLFRVADACGENDCDEVRGNA